MMHAKLFFLSKFRPVLIALSCLFSCCLTATAGQVVITPDKVEATLFKSDDAVCYGSFADTHVNLGNESKTGKIGFNEQDCTVGGGIGNEARGDRSTVIGGYGNIADGDGSVVCGGYNNTAGGDISWAGCLHMQLTEEAENTFVWGYKPSTPETIATPNAFLIFPAGTPGMVGIGTTAPAEKLHIRERSVALRAAILLDSTGGASGRQYYMGSTLSGNIGGAGLFQIYDDTANSPRLNITPAGNVGIGTTSPAAKLDVAGNVRCVALTQTSDLRYKKDIQPLASPLERISQLNGVSYHWRTDEFPGMGLNRDKQIGLIAQEVEPVLPELVIHDKNGFKSIAYGNLTAVLVEAVKELKAQNEKQQKFMEQQQSEIEVLRALIKGLKG